LFSYFSIEEYSLRKHYLKEGKILIEIKI